MGRAPAWMAVAALLAGGVGAPLVGGCGDAVVPGSYRGEVLYAIDGWVQLMVSPSALLGEGDDAAELRVAVLWSQTKGSSFELEGAVEQEVVATGSFPARFRVTLYEPPNDDILREVPGGTGEMAIAALVAYVDSDGDMHWDRGEEDLVGGAEERLFLYTPDGVSSGVLGELGPGFHRLVPTTACDDPSVVSEGSVLYSVDTSAEIDLTVDGEFPMTALFDVDCDPDTFDWAGVCPPLDHVRRECRDGGGGVVADPTSSMCQACGGRLWPEAAEGNDDACDDWLVTCLENAPPQECEFEWHICRDEDSPWGEHPQDHCDLRCVCDHVYDECRENGGTQDTCLYQRDVCLRR